MWYASGFRENKWGKRQKKNFWQFLAATSFLTNLITNFPDSIASSGDKKWRCDAKVRDQVWFKKRYRGQKDDWRISFVNFPTCPHYAVTHLHCHREDGFHPPKPWVEILTALNSRSPWAASLSPSTKDFVNFFDVEKSRFSESTRMLMGSTRSCFALQLRW